MYTGQNRRTEYVRVKKALKDMVLQLNKCIKQHIPFVLKLSQWKSFSQQNVCNDSTKQLSIFKLLLYGYHSRQC